jgi:hypothetical protein
MTGDAGEIEAERAWFTANWAAGGLMEEGVVALSVTEAQ